MKLLVSFTIYPNSGNLRQAGREVLPELFAEMVEKWPENLTPAKTGLTFAGDPDSAFILEVFKFLDKRAGKIPRFTQYPYIYDDPTQIPLQGTRVFEPSEIDAAPLLWCFPEKELSDSGLWEFDEIGGRKLKVPRSSIKRQPIGESYGSFDFLCTDTSRREIEAAGFRNLHFEEVIVTGKKPPVEPIWMLLGERAMPPVLNRLVNGEGKPPDSPVARPIKQGCWVDDLYFPPILRYRRREVEAAFGDFDISHTAERWRSGEYQYRSHNLICSQRFRRWCEERKWKLTWVPVELED
jgi:hypothetical protein